jgi:hypothetical protein
MALVGTITPANDLFFRNKIINGDMRIWQRATSFASAALSNTYNVDRFSAYTSGAVRIAVARDTDVPSNQGFLYSHKSTVGTTASTSAYYTILQRIEGNQIVDFFAGRTGCVAHTISFWFKTSVAQTYSGSARLASASSCYAFDFTATAINTWTKVVINIPANTTQSVTIDESEAYSLCITPFLNTNVGLNGTANTWTSSNLHASSNVGGTWGNTSGATFYLTGVQIERGNVASDFEFRDYSSELMRCMRYYEAVTPASGYWYSVRNDAGTSRLVLPWIVPKRAAPSVTLAGNVGSGSFTALASVLSTSIWNSDCGNSSGCSFSTYTASAEL